MGNSPVDLGTKINASPLSGKFAEKFAAKLAESKATANSIFECQKDIGKNIKLDTERLASPLQKQGLFSKIKGAASKAWNGIKSIPAKIASKFKSGASSTTNSGSKLAGAKNWIKGMGGKIKNGLKAAPSKVGRFFKGKGGKWALVGLAAAAVTAAGVGIYKAVKGNSDNKAQETEGADKANKPAQPEKPQAKPTEEPPEEDPAKDEEPTKTDNKPTDKTSSDKKAGSTTGSAAAATTGSAQDPNKTDKTDKADKAKTKTDDETPDVPTVHIVVKGDNVWNIAKKHLQDINGKKPTNAEILKHTKELMEINGLEFAPDGKRVMIRPNDELKLIA